MSRKKQDGAVRVIYDKPNKADPSPSEETLAPQDLQPVQSESIDSVSLPPLTHLDTKSPVQLNQPVNFYQQIPATAWATLLT